MDSRTQSAWGQNKNTGKDKDKGEGGQGDMRLTDEPPESPGPRYSPDGEMLFDKRTRQGQHNPSKNAENEEQSKHATSRQARAHLGRQPRPSREVVGSPPEPRARRARLPGSTRQKSSRTLDERASPARGGSSSSSWKTEARNSAPPETPHAQSQQWQSKVTPAVALHQRHTAHLSPQQTKQGMRVAQRPATAAAVAEQMNRPKQQEGGEEEQAAVVKALERERSVSDGLRQRLAMAEAHIIASAQTQQTSMH